MSTPKAPSALYFLLASLVAVSAHAAEPPAKEKAKESSAAVDVSSTQTDIVGSKEAPSVFNIVPWKEKNMETSKRTVNTSILREALQPLDKEVLQREIQLQRQLSIE